ncbi:putative Zn-dependent protease [Elusimicrobium simillimum]|uniref:metallopeptidase TldD-related protein n=1 Tax=Elusimicrobium simillimum TaxID=3143438 RepID=UPI003C6FE8DF
MKNIIFALLLALPLNIFALDYDTAVKAMQDEMNRNKKGLHMKGLKKPYFITYNLEDRYQYSLGASLGALLRDTGGAKQRGYVNMRVGDKKNDNTGYGYSPNYFQYNTIWYSAGAGYNLIRDSFWQASEAAYKQSLDQLSRKEAYKQQRNMEDDLDDFSPVPKNVIREDTNKEVFSHEYFENAVKELSKIGLKYPDLDKFVVFINYDNYQNYYLDSEGSFYYRNPVIVYFDVTTELQTENGFKLSESLSRTYMSVKDVPQLEELKEEVEAFAAKTAALKKAKKIDSYIGPVWYAKGAGADFLDNVFVPAASNTKTTWYERGGNKVGEFADKKGLRVISSFFNVTDDPLLKEYNGKTLAGYYKMDEEGAPAKKVELVKHGKLTDLLTTRSLIKGQKVSNGHARDVRTPSAGVSNLFFEAETTVPEAEMKALFMQECAKQELEYCLKSEGNSSSVLYRVYTADGREEPVYGAVFNNLNTRSLRDIIYAGDKMRVTNIVNKYPYAIIAPALIVGEVEVKPTQTQPDKLPMVKQP